MGILANSTEEDIAALAKIADLSLKAWDVYRVDLPENERLDVEINDGILQTISELGDKVLHAHFIDPTFLDRIATLVVLSNCCPYFKLSRNKKLVSDCQVRRSFVAKLSCVFVQAALRKFVPDGPAGYYSFTGFKNETKLLRFLSFLDFLDGVEIRNTASGGKKELVEHALKTFQRT